MKDNVIHKPYILVPYVLTYPNKTRGDVWRTLEELELKGEQEVNLYDMSFTKHIASIWVLRWIRPPRFKKYDRTTDLVEHIFYYQHVVSPFEAPLENKDVVMCKVITRSLKGQALLWFDQLISGLMSSLENLAREFEAQFAMSEETSEITPFGGHLPSKKLCTRKANDLRKWLFTAKGIPKEMQELAVLEHDPCQHA